MSSFALRVIYTKIGFGGLSPEAFSEGGCWDLIKQPIKVLTSSPLSLGNPATISAKIQGADLGLWLCVCAFRRIYLYRLQ
jgi:hypothetical protein